jgi:hypothetical protein
MTTTTSRFEQALALVREFSAVEKVRFVEEVMNALEADLNHPPVPKKSLYGMWAGLVDISEEDIAEARREMWGNFPREDI